MEETHHDAGVSPKCCHGRSFDGANCTPFMEQSTSVFASAATLLLEIRDVGLATQEEIQMKSKACAKLMDCCDSHWSNLHGLESGLSPTDAQLEFLETAVAEGKRQWLELGLTTNQPKRHLTFDGHHLLNCAKTFGGVADESGDAAIEKDH
jgi:hypothetical protein